MASVDPRLEPPIALAEEVALDVSLLDFVDEPDMSLKRLVVPRVAPILDADPDVEPEVVPDPVPDVEPDPVNPELLLLDDDEEEVEEVEELALEEELVLPEPPPEEKLRPRSLRLPRICGAMTEANFSA